MQKVIIHLFQSPSPLGAGVFPGGIRCRHHSRCGRSKWTEQGIKLLLYLQQHYCDIHTKNRDYHLEAFNSLIAPGEDPSKTNCFQLLSVHLENPSAPLNFLNSLFSLHYELDYMITLLPRWNNFL